MERCRHLFPGSLGPRFKTYWVDEDEEKNLRVAITKRNDVKMKLALEEINIRANSGDFQIIKSLKI